MEAHVWQSKQKIKLRFVEIFSVAHVKSKLELKVKFWDKSWNFEIQIQMLRSQNYEKDINKNFESKFFGIRGKKQRFYYEKN